MPSGGHARAGRRQKTADERNLAGSRTRPWHVAADESREVAAGSICAPPRGLSKAERRYWDYYATELQIDGRLPLKARDVLAKYCTALAQISQLKRALESRKPDDIAARANNLRELRQWVLACRMIENDLLLNPAQAERFPSPKRKPASKLHDLISNKNRYFSTPLSKASGE